MEIVGHLQTYEWGKLGKESLVAQIHSSNVDYSVDANTPYAELWMGIHNNGEALIKENMQPLSDWLKDNSKRIGGLDNQWCLPFLFKVLSVNKALSIQCHPNKAQAIDLFKRMPSIYKDDNHKPEMTIALTAFEVMSGFRPVEDIIQFLREVPELEVLLSKELISSYITEGKKENMRQILESWLAKKPEDMEPIIKHYLKRLENEAGDIKNRQLYPIIKQLSEWYANDVGVFMPFFLNYFTLQPGECMFIAPGVPHAYIKGDCVECMSCSDNVVRCGLTPKLKDVDVLLEILDFQSFSVDQLKMKGVSSSAGNAVVFNPPDQEFGVTRVTMGTGEIYEIPAYKSCSILIVISGKGNFGKGSDQKSLQFGSIFFLLPNEVGMIQCTESGPMIAYFAYGVK